MPEATSSGEPDAGNLHVRFDEGRGTLKVPSYSTGSEGSHGREGVYVASVVAVAELLF
jgi:hypothetical protein